jgi:WD40 repeat protein
MTLSELKKYILSLSMIGILLFAVHGMVFAAEKVDIFVQLGHSSVNTVKSVVFSPDGRYVLSVGGDKAAIIWDAATGKEIRRFSEGRDNVSCAIFSPDGRQVITGDTDSIKIWDSVTGKELRTLKEGAQSLVFSHDGRYLLSGGFGSITLWGAATGERIRTFQGKVDEASSDVHALSANAVAISSDGRTAVSGGEYGFLRIWDVSTGKELKKIKAHQKNVRSVAFSRNGRYILTAGDEDKTVKLWEASTGKLRRTLKGHSERVESVAFSPDDRFALSGSDRTIRIWDISTGKGIKAFVGETDEDQSQGIASFSPDGKTILAGGSGGSAPVIWDVATGKKIMAFRGYTKRVSSVKLSPDGKHILSIIVGSGGTIWDFQTGHLVKLIPINGPLLDLSPDGRQAATCWWDDNLSHNVLKLFSTETGEEIKVFSGNAGNISKAHFSPDGKYVASFEVNCEVCNSDVKLWDKASGTCIKVFKGHLKHIGAVAFSPDGRHLLSADDGGSIKLWDIMVSRNVWTSKPKHGSFMAPALAFSPNGRYFLSGDVNSLKLWNTADGKEIRNFSDAGYTLALAFSPDGKYAISGNYDNALKLWDVGTGEGIKTFSGNLAHINMLAFSHDGRHVLTGSNDGTTRLWDVATGKEVARMISFTDGEWIVITPEGYFNASPNGAKHLNVRVGNKVYGIDQFYAKFYRPELVQLALAGKEMPKGELITDIAAQKPAPNVQIMSPVTNSSVDQDNVAVTLKITDNGGGIGSVNVYLNGAQVANDTRGVIVKGKASANERILSFTMPLIKGLNEIRAVAFNGENSMESNPALISVISSAVMQKPDLYALVIGINTYRNKSISLTYAVPDAIAFAGTLQKIASPLFEKADIRTLITPAATTKEAITKAFEEVRQMVKPNDLFIFYNASHGMVDVVNGEEQYFLLTSNVRLLSSQHISKDALSHKDLVSLIGSIPAQKKLVILDTCNAGKGGKEIQIALLQQTRGLTDATAVKLLQRAVGSSVFSASADTQQALEGYKGHGLFTYVLLEGLQGKADFKKDGFITVKGLALHTEERVMTLSEEVFKRQQNPMIETGVNDFPIGKVR